MNKELENRNIRGLILKLLPAQIFVFVASSLAGIVNGMLVGNYLPSESMVALGFVVPLTALIAAVAQVLSGGSGIVVGFHMGSGKIREINRTFTVSVITCVSIGALLSLFCFILSTPLSYLLGARNESVAITASYIQSLSIGFIGQILLASLMVYLNMGNKSKVSLLLTIVMAAANLYFGLVFLKQMHGEIFAVGLATSLSQLITAVIALIYILVNGQLVEFERGGFNMKIVKDILRLGFPAALGSILYAVRNIFVNTACLSVGGAVSVNAMAIVSSVSGVFDAFNIGIGTTSLMISSIFVGEKDRASIVRLGKSAMKIGMVLAIAKVAVLVFFGRNIATVFGGEGAVIEEGAAALRFYGYAMPLNIIAITLINIYQTLSKATLCNINYLINCIIVPLICCFVFGPLFGTRGIYILYALAEAVSLAFFYYSASKTKKIQSFDEMICSPDAFEEVESLSFSLNREEEVVEVSKSVIEYLEKMSIDSKRAKMTGLCCEEMCSNIVDHGFTKDKKKHVIDVYLAVVDNEIFLRIKDDCIPFDPRSRLSVVEPKDPCKNIGIRMVTRIAKEVKYQIYFGMNILTIKM